MPINDLKWRINICVCTDHFMAFINFIKFHASLLITKLELDKEEKDLEIEGKFLEQLQNTIDSLNNFLEAKEGLVTDWEEKRKMEKNSKCILVV